MSFLNGSAPALRAAKSKSLHRRQARQCRGSTSFQLESTYGNRNTRGIPERVLGRNRRPDFDELSRSSRARRTCFANLENTSAKAVCRPGGCGRGRRKKASTSQLG